MYSQLEKYNLPHPEAVFEIGYFKRKPQAFYMLAKVCVAALLGPPQACLRGSASNTSTALTPPTCLQELFPGNFKPTPTHHFINLLHQKGLLLRCFTQVGTHIASVPAGMSTCKPQLPPCLKRPTPHNSKMQQPALPT